MATSVKEIKLKKNGAMVSPIVLIDSLRNLDGTKYKDTVSAALNGKSNSEHTHDDRYYTESEIDSKVSSLTSAINGKANSSHNHFSVTSNYTMSWVDDSSYDNEGYYKITVPDCELGKIQICNFTYNREFEQDEDIEFFLPSNSNMYFVISTGVHSSSGAAKTSFEGIYTKGGNKIGWGTFSQYIGYGQSNHTITVVYARVS